MTKFPQKLVSCLLILLTAACAPGFPTLPWLPTAIPTRTRTPGAGASATPPATATTAAGSPTPGITTVRIWLPPQLDPNGPSAASKLLKARLDGYLSTHQGITLDVRIKGKDEPGGLLEALSLTRSAAPDILPDLVALARTDLEAAALKGMLHPLNELTGELGGADWYPYARESGRVQNADYGLPFAGDALAIAYRPSQFEKTPTTWEELFAKERSLALVGNDPTDLLLLNLYLSTGSPLLDSSNEPYLEQDSLQKVLETVQGGKLVPLQSQEAVWTAFVDQRADMALVWSSQFLQEDRQDDTALLPLPSLEGAPFVLGRTWAWALAGSNTRNDAAAVELAVWLTADDFIAKWDQAAGYLSPRPNAMDLWDSNGMLDLISQSAELVPGNDLLAAMAPIFQEALNRTLNGDPPADVAQSAVEALK